MSSDQVAVRIATARHAVRAGQLDAAARIAAEILRDSPDELDALEIKALVEIERSDHSAAEATLRRAIAIAPGRRWPYADLTRLLMMLGRASDAERVAADASLADPDNPDAHATLAALLAERQNLVAAAAHFERAIALAGRHRDLLLGLGRTRMRQGLLDQARPLLEQAVAASPEALEPIVALAELEERFGRFEQAKRQLDRAEAIAAAQGTDVVLQRSVLLGRMGEVEAALALLDSAGALSGAALLQRGRLNARLGRHAQAWSDWSDGKAMLAARFGRNYPAQIVKREFDALADFFDRRRLAALPRAQCRRDVPQPIFIVGFPRSGTTLVEQILASHSAIRAGGELPIAGEFKDIAVALGGARATFPACLAEIDGAQWPNVLRDSYLARADSFGLLGPGADYFTDKMPLNEMWLPLLRIAFPQSPVVLVRRHPLDVLASVMANDMTHGFNCGYQLEDAARHLALIDELTARYAAAGLEPTHVLRYESLVADQLGETGRLMTAIGVPMEPAQLRFDERASVSPTASYAAVREPLNERSVGKWRNYAAELDPVRPIIARASKRGDYRC